MHDPFATPVNSRSPALEEEKNKLPDTLENDTSLEPIYGLTEKEGFENDSSLTFPEKKGVITTTESVAAKFVPPRIPIRIILLLIISTMGQAYSGSIISIFMNKVLHLSAEDQLKYYMYLGFTSWPEPAVGFLSDAFVVFGERRRPLLLVGCVGNLIIYIIYCFAPSSTATSSVFFGVSMVAQVCLMFIYVSINGLLVDIGRRDEEEHEESTARIGSIMSKAMLWRSTGTLIASILQTYLLVDIDVRSALGITAVFFGLTIPAALITPRKLFLRKLNQPNIFMRFLDCAKEIRRNWTKFDYHSDSVCMILVLVFVFLYTMMPDSGNIYTTYLYTYDYPNWLYSFIFCLYDLGSIIGAGIFAFWMSRKSKRELETGKHTSTFFIFMLGSLAWALSYSTNILLCTGFIKDVLHISPEVFIPIDYFVNAILVRFAFMPTIAVAAEHAPRVFEATCFETFSVASVGGGTVSNIITLAIVADAGIANDNYKKLWIMVLISICCKLAMIPLALLLPEKRRSVDVIDDVESLGEEKLLSSASPETESQ